jgi:cell filamentation protein
MTDHGYTASQDLYCYPLTTVLRNKLGFRTQAELDNHEALATASRFADPFPEGTFDIAHYRAIHKHLFHDVFDWAGEYRTVRIGKGGNMFCYPEYIESEMNSLFEKLGQQLLGEQLQRAEYAKRASLFLAELNAIHPFREGNGRAQLAYLTLLSAQVGHPLRQDGFEPKKFLEAMIASFQGDVTLLERCITGNHNP